MKIVFIPSKYSNYFELTENKIYTCDKFSSKNIGLLFYYIKNDQNSKKLYPSNSFINLNEWRKNKIKNIYKR